LSTVQSVLRVMAGAMTSRGGIVLPTVSRSPQDRAFSDEETALVRLLLPHFQRALGIQERLSREPMATRAGESITPLTVTEEVFASRLAADGSVTEICRELRIRETTARTHLRHLFQKTQTRRQAALAAWLLRSRAASDTHDS
jgi:DNA-binding CsgD family transcriptional regulator